MKGLERKLEHYSQHNQGGKTMINLNQNELSEIAYLLHREVQEMREGWQLAGIGQADRLAAIQIKIENELIKTVR